MGPVGARAHVGVEVICWPRCGITALGPVAEVLGRKRPGKIFKMAGDVGGMRGRILDDAGAKLLITRNDETVTDAGGGDIKVA